MALDSFTGADAFAAQTPALVSGGYEVWIPERRGHARTADTDAPFTYASMAEETAAGRFPAADVVTHVCDLAGIEAAFARLRRGEGARTVAVLDARLAGADSLPFALAGDS